MSAYLTEACRAPLSSSQKSEEKYFWNDIYQDLVLVRGGRILELYYPKRVKLGDDEDSVHLQRLYHEKLYGQVESLATLPGRAGRDAILITFRDAKLSVLQWDKTRHSLTPSSLHYFEGDESLKAGRESFPRPPRAIADPDGRCAAVVMFRHQIAILPAFQSESESLGVLEGTNNAVENEGTIAAVGNSYVDNLSKIGIRDVRDAVFLNGVAEPTLLLMHESDIDIKTEEEKAYSRKDACQLSALSLNLSARRHPRIWHIADIPSDAHRLTAVPSGGVLIITSTCILYYNQGVKSGIVLNTMAIPSEEVPPPLGFDLAKETPDEAAAQYARKYGTKLHPNMASSVLKFCNIEYAKWNLDLVGASIAWCPQGYGNEFDTANTSVGLLGLKNGQLLVLHVQRLGEKLVLNAEKLGSSPPISCLSPLGSSYFLIGSISGDSLLVRYEIKLGLEDVATSESQLSTKRRRLIRSDDHINHQSDPSSESNSSNENIESLIYGEEVDSASFKKWSLRVLDNLIGIGPVRSLVKCYRETDTQSKRSPYLVVCCGDERAGSLAVLQRSVIPEVITNVPLPGILGVWAVGEDTTQGFNENNGSSDLKRTIHQSYLLISRPNKTQVLEASTNMRDVTEELDFAGDVTTIDAATVLDDTFVLQVFPQGLRLLRNGELCEDLMAATIALSHDLDSNTVLIRESSILKSCALVRLSDGSIVLIRLELPSKSLSQFMSVAGLRTPESNNKVTASCLYYDTSSWLQRQLFGNNDGIDLNCDASERIFVVSVHQYGKMSIWNLDGFQSSEKPLWESSCTCSNGPLVIFEGKQDAQDKSTDNYVCEVRMECFGDIISTTNDSRKEISPLLPNPVVVLITSDDCMYVYHAFSVKGRNPAGGPRCLRFRKVLLELPALVPKSDDAESMDDLHMSRIFRFDKLGNNFAYSGIFVTGRIPLWLIIAKGIIWLHRGGSEASQVSGFTVFHNLNCPHGFIEVVGGNSGWLSIASLPEKLRLDAPWARQKIPIKATPLTSCLYPEANLLALLTSANRPYKPFLPSETGGEPQASYAYALADSVASFHGTYSQNELRLIRPFSWNTFWRYPLIPGESACCIESVHLHDNATGSTVPLIAVGTGFAAGGEDYPCSGRVLLFEITRKPEHNMKESEWDSKLVFSREFKGPVMGLKALEGNLLLSTGNRLEICTLTSDIVRKKSNVGENTEVQEENEIPICEDSRSYRLQRSAFYDGSILATSLRVVKKFVLVGDIQHGLQFIRYRDEGKQLMMLSKDFGQSSVRSAQFLISGTSLHFIAADFGGNILAFTYSPKDPSSWRGQKLKQWGAMHIGRGVGAMESIQMPQKESKAVRAGIVCGTDSGGLDGILPVIVDDDIIKSFESEKLQYSSSGSSIESIIRSLIRELTLGIAHTAGLNPSAFRRRYVKCLNEFEGPRPFGPPLVLAEQGILDGELLFEFPFLHIDEQRIISAKAGLHRRAVLGLISNLQSNSYLF